MGGGSRLRNKKDCKISVADTRRQNQQEANRRSGEWITLQPGVRASLAVA